MLRKIRIALAAVVFVLITALFLDYTGTLHHWLGWLAKIQFLPALLALNVGVVVSLVLLTLVFGRVYCSVICPLGIFQDIISWFSGLRKKKKYRFSYSPAKSWLRYTVLVLFVVAMIAGVGSFVALLAPYSAYGRMVQNLLMPLYDWANNGIAYLAERAGSYAVYDKEVWVRSWVTFGVALTTFVVLFVLAWRNGRTYCNTICPVGTMLSFLARFSWFRVHIDTNKCNGCHLCERSCKAACIDAANHTVDYSRCVTCGNCLEKCRRNAISYTHTPLRKPATDTPKDSAEPVDTSRRSFLVGAAIATSAAALAQEKKKIDGGLAVIEDKVAPKRLTPITPPGSLSAKNMAKHCTACQLCVSACPNDVLRPSQEMFENSLRELQTDYVDYLLLHGIGFGQKPMEEFYQRYIDNGILDWLVEQKRKGRIRNLGFSYHGDIHVFDLALRWFDEGKYHWDFAQIELNYLDWHYANEINPRNTDAEYLYGELHKRGIPAVIMEPLLGGRLARVPDYIVAKMKSREPEQSVAS